MSRVPRLLARGAAVTALLLPVLTQAQEAVGLPAFTSQGVGNGATQYSLSIQTLILLTLLSLLPAMLMTMTAFTRILVVLGLLRQAMGTGNTPSNPIIVGLSLFLTLFVMQPAMDRMYSEAIKPYIDGQMEFQLALEKAQVPLRAFMFAQTREADLLTFSKLAGNTQGYASPDQVPFRVLAPSFLTSELTTAFQIGFLLFIPFIVIDLVVSSVLMSMGMMMLSPMLVSLPFKLMLFVLVDGWSLVMGSLAASFHPA